MCGPDHASKVVQVTKIGQIHVNMNVQNFKLMDRVEIDAWYFGLAENCPISSPVRLLIQKLFWASEEDCKIASCIVSTHMKRHQIWRVSRQP